MSLPASDAFSLSHDTNRTRLSSSLRATSPKLPFVSSQQARAVSQSHTADNSRKTIRPRTAREHPMGDPNGFAPPSNGHATEQNGTQTQTGNGYGIKSRSRSPSKHLRRRSSSKQQAVPVVVVARSQSSSPAAVPIDWEIPRKTLHSSIGFLTLYLYFSHGSPKPVVNALGAALAVIAPADILRLNHSGFEKIYERCLGFLMRESEKKSTNGVIWYIIGVIWVLTLYPLDVAVVSILILSWADTAASTIGRLWGRYTPRLPKRFLGLPFAPRKSVAGFIAGSVTGAVIAGGFWGLYGHSGIVEPIWDWESGVAGTSGALAGWLGLGVVSIVSGLVSGVAEALDLGSADDNLTLPIISGGCLLAFFNCVRYFFS